MIRASPVSHWRRGRSDRHLRRVMQQPASPSRDGALWLWAAIPIPMGHVFEADDRLSNSVTAGGRLSIAAWDAGNPSGNPARAQK